MVVVTLTYPEICLGAHVGTMRRVQNMKLGTARKYGQKEGGWQADIMSCLGELAAAKHLDMFWAGAIGNYDAADVGEFYEVRATEWPNGKLILHPDDPDDAPHILARVTDNKVTLVGWVYGHEGKRPEYWTTVAGHPNRPAFFVPNDVLHDMAEIPLALGVT
jgi:hypothetical protein